MPELDTTFCTASSSGLEAPVLFPFQIWAPEMAPVICHFSPFSTEFLGPKWHRHPGQPPLLLWRGGAMSYWKGS